MDDLISRQAAKLAIVEKGQASKRYKIGEFWELNRDEIWDALDGVPSAQPDLDEWCTDCKEYDKEKHHCPRFNRVIREALNDAGPRKPGHWEIYIISMFDGEGCRCSECGFEGAPYWDFCPNCGADMRGEQNA